MIIVLRFGRCWVEDFVISWVGQGVGERSLSDFYGNFSFKGLNKGREVSK